MKIFKKVSRAGDTDQGIVEVYQCQEAATDKIKLMYHFNYFSSRGRQLSSIDWSFVRNEDLWFSGTEDIPIGDWISEPLSWKKQLEKRIGEIKTID